MNKIKYILIAVIALAFFACEDTVYLDVTNSPTKIVEAEREGIFLLSDRIVAKNTIGTDVMVSYTIINPDGSRTLSDSVYMEFLERASTYGMKWSSNSDNEVFIAYPHNEGYYHLAKFDKNAKLLFYRKLPFNAISDQSVCTPLDNGEFAYFYHDDDANKVIMVIIDKHGNQKKDIILSGEMEGYETQLWDTKVIACGDKLFICDYNYYIFNIDGVLEKSGALEYRCANIKYIDGYIYILGYADAGEENYNIYNITKMDTNGNKIFTTLGLPDLQYPNNIMVNGNMLIAIGTYQKDEHSGYESKTVGRLFLLDNNDGSFKETITLDYDGDVRPIAVFPAKDGGYDVYLERYKAVNKWINNSFL